LEKTKELEAIMEEQAQIEKVSKEIQLDLEEMSKHHVYQKYAFLSIKEIREAMFDSPCHEELEIRDTNCA
jgi:hypothetical protein